MRADLDLLMTNEEIRRAFGLRVKALRKQKGWTQKELAAKLGIRFSLLNKYECGLHTPPADRLIALAEIFETTIDYLLTGEETDTTPIHSHRLLERFRMIQQLGNEDRETVIELIDALILKRRVEGILDGDYSGVTT